jgi:hypothetical protein
MTDAPELDEKSDNDAEVTLGELKSVELPPQRRICLTYGDQSVEITAPDDLKTIAELAASLWLITTPPQQVRMGFAAGGTLYTERLPSDLVEQDEQEQRS